MHNYVGMMIKIKEFSSIPRITHGFFTRQGGVSTGVYNSLNCGYGSNDQFERVEANRRRIIEKLGIQGGSLITCNQIHSAKVVNVVKPWSHERSPKADGLVTNLPGLMLGILTADCAPVLFTDDLAGIIGAAHAGWKGALNGILESTVDEMVKLGSSRSNIQAAIGPCIGLKSYEVGPEFKELFIGEKRANEQFFRNSTKIGYYKFDLKSYIRCRLLNTSISNVYETKYDTYSEKELFFSYRRSVLEGENDYGRSLSAISILP